MSGGHTGNEQVGASLSALFSLGAADVPISPPTSYHSQRFHFDGKINEYFKK